MNYVYITHFTSWIEDFIRLSNVDTPYMLLADLNSTDISKIHTPEELFKVSERLLTNKCGLVLFANKNMIFIHRYIDTLLFHELKSYLNTDSKKIYGYRKIDNSSPLEADEEIIGALSEISDNESVSVTKLRMCLKGLVMEEWNSSE